jgi:glutamyl-tRNA synthetase
MILGPTAPSSPSATAPSACCSTGRGFLPEAVLNYLVRLGWSHGDQEIFSIEEMIAALFDIAGCQQIGLGVQFEKLAWLNQQHMMRAPGRIVPVLRWHLERLGIDAARTMRSSSRSRRAARARQDARKWRQQPVFLLPRRPTMRRPCAST